MLAIKTLLLKSILFKRAVRLMGNQFEITVIGNDPHWAEARIDDAVAEINRVEKLLSTFSDDSNINEINRYAGLKPVKTEAEIFRLIDRSMKIAELTHGAFDITYYTANKDIEVFPDNGHALMEETIETGDVNNRNVVLDTKQQTVFLQKKGMRIGLKAVIKGYAADRAKYILQMQGVSSGVINAGGDLLTWGTQPDNEPWTIAAADPYQKKLPYANVEISNMAVATSIDAEKHMAVMNKKRLDNIKPVNGFTVSEIKSVSIISTCAELADALATPVMSIGINAGLYLINQLNQIACVIIDDHDRVYTSKDVNFAR